MRRRVIIIFVLKTESNKSTLKMKTTYEENKKTTSMSPMWFSSFYMVGFAIHKKINQVDYKENKSLF